MVGNAEGFLQHLTLLVQLRHTVVGGLELLACGSYLTQVVFKGQQDTAERLPGEQQERENRSQDTNSLVVACRHTW